MGQIMGASTKISKMFHQIRLQLKNHQNQLKQSTIFEIFNICIEFPYRIKQFQKQINHKNNENMTITF